MAINTTLTLYYIENLPDNENYAMDVTNYYDGVIRPLYAYLKQTARTYLDISNFQLQRIELESMFVVELSQNYAISNDSINLNYNYCTLYVHDDYLNYELPYRIQKILWNGTASCKIYAKLDVASFYLNYEHNPTIFKDGIIERSHIDRFSGTTTIGGNDYLIPIIDYHDEPFAEPPKYLNRTQAINNKLGVDTIEQKRWNIVYYSDPNVTKGIRTFIVPDEDVASITARIPQSSSTTIEADTYYIIRGVDNGGKTITFNGNTFTFGSTSYAYEEIHIMNDGGTFRCYVYGFNLHPTANNWNDYNTSRIATYSSTTATSFSYSGDIVYYKNPLHEEQQFYTSSQAAAIPFTPKSKVSVSYNATTSSVALTGLNSIPLTNPRLIKIIACPFIPADITDTPCIYTNVADDYMTINVIEYLGNEFLTESKYTATLLDKISVPPSYDEQLHSIDYETKLYNSNYTEYCYEYGSYKYIIQPEIFKYESVLVNLDVNISYKQAMLKSDCLFYFYSANDPKSELPSDEHNLVSRYLISDIDNEKPIFTSDYINYIKNGYNYDKANMNRQTIVSSLLAGTSILGGVAGVAAGAVTGGVSAAAGIGLITSGVSSVVNIINNRIASETSINQKLTSYKNSSTGVAGVNALDLRKQYHATQLMESEYLMSDDLKNYIYNLFRKYGYQLNKYDDNINSYIYSRRYYNYIKFKEFEFDPEFVAKNKKHSDLLNEFKKILMEGITIYHLTGATKDFDFEKKYENFEIILS